MWPFFGKMNLPGFKRDNRGNIIFELTQEEKEEIQKVIDTLTKRSDGEYVVKKESVKEIQREMTVLGLFFYAKDQIMKSKFDSNKDKKGEFINKAIASILKAYHFCPLPIYIYDMACFMEMNGKNEEAKDVFKNFLELQSNFLPSQSQEMLLSAQARDIEEAIKDAKEKIK